MAPTIRDIKVICTAPEGINLVVVKVETSEPGLYGLGCATFAYRHLTVQHLIETYLRPLLIGKDVRNISDLWQLMHQNAYWRCGPIVNNAISGVDMALWDIKGKFFNAPVYQLMGGACRDNMRVYSWIGGDRPSDVGTAALEKKNAGFTAIKMNATEELQMIDTYDKVDAVLERVAAIRETVTIQQEIIMQEDV